MHNTDAAAAADLNAIGGSGAMVVGIIISAVVGLLSIKFLLDFLKRRSLMAFSVYRLILGALVIISAVAGVIK